MILYHNTSNENAVNISRTGLKGGMRLSAYGKGSEAEGAGIWCTNKRYYGGYGGATITFDWDENDKDLIRQNDDEYILYKDVPVENIIDIDLVVHTIPCSNKCDITTESLIVDGIEYYGKDELLEVFGRYKDKFVKPYDYEELEELINTGNKMLIGTIDIPKQVNEGIVINLSKMKYQKPLTEARMGQLAGKTRSQTDNIGNRVNGFEKVYKNGIAVGTRELPKMSTDYIGISKFGIFNFRTTSQTHQGSYWYQTIEIPDLGTKLQDEKITPDLIRELFERGDIKVYCDDPSFLYWAFKYMAYTRDYGSEPETRAPKLNNVRLKGALCKHLLNVVDLIQSGSLYEQMAKDCDNWMKYQSGAAYKNFHKARLMGDALRKKNRINYEKYDSYLNDYFASKAGINKFLDDEDIKNSLKAEIERTAKTDPSMTLDDFIKEEFGVDGIQGLANELQIDVDYVKQYFKDIGF